jgi:glucose-1-phosphate thymidylyltransferase
VNAKGLIIAHARTGGPRARWPLGDTPPVLAPVANRPLLAHQLEAMQAAGIEEVGVVSAPALSARVRAAVGEGDSAGVRVTHISPPGPLGVVDALLVAEHYVGAEPFVVQLGGHLVRHDLGAAVAELDDGVDAVLVGEPVPDPATLEGVLHAEMPPAPATAVASSVAGLARVDVMAFAAGVFTTIRELATEGWERLEIGDVVARLSRSERVRARPVEGWARCVADAADLLDVNQRLLADLVGSYEEDRLVDAAVQGAVVIHPTATVQSSTLRGPSIVGANAILSDAFIGPYTSIGDGASVEGTEMENCVILPGAVLKHPGVRLEGSVIGEKARVSRQFELPRALRLWVGKDAEVTLG